jgi:hypothetical protein
MFLLVLLLCGHAVIGAFVQLTAHKPERVLKLQIVPVVYLHQQLRSLVIMFPLALRIHGLAETGVPVLFREYKLAVAPKLLIAPALKQHHQ